MGSGLAGEGESRDDGALWDPVFLIMQFMGRNFGEFVGMIRTRKVVVLWGPSEGVVVFFSLPKYSQIRILGALNTVVGYIY